MADLAYFLKLNQPLEDIARDPDACVHVHMAGEGAQPGVGDLTAAHRRLFEVLRDIGYEGGVTFACQWVGEFADASAKALQYAQDLRDQVFRQ